MPRSIKSLKAGLPPGTLIHVGEKRAEKTKITIIDYDENEFEEKEAKNVKECFPFKDKPTVTWINVDGIHEVDKVEKIGSHFNLHPLILEDILNTEQRPKIDDLDEYLIIIMKMFVGGENHKITVEQVSLILGPNFVISFQEREGDIFDPLRDRIRNGKSRIRKMGADYLAYAMVDSIVDSYFVILERFGGRIEDIEEELITDPGAQTIQTIHKLKREMIYLRRSVWPLREVVNRLERGESKLIAESTRIYLMDVYDHTIQVIDTIETYRDILSGLLDLYLSSISNKMNEVMKVLTIIATIFIPLTFLTGIYGMNFQSMPELGWRFGYPAVWLVMISLSLSMLVYFKRKGWI